MEKQMGNLVKIFIDEVSEKSELQKKYLENWQITDDEIDELNIILHFFIEEFNYEMDFIVDAYLFINNMAMEETYYFIRNGKYRNSTFEEVNEIVYANPEYMKKYMMGLSILDYTSSFHLKMLRYFENNMNMFSGKRYLEIGPGFGQYLIKVILNCNFEKFCACDISKTSVDGSNAYLKYRNLSDKCTVIEKDFFQFVSEESFDCILMGEVLEHVEQPLMMLNKIYELLNRGGKAFITTVINTPTVDHISLFSSIEQVVDLVKDAGFKVIDYMYATEGNLSLEKVVKRKQAISIALILEK